MTTKDKPLQVLQWQATNPAARDFRLDTFGPKWQSQPLNDEGGVFIGQVRKPPQGWTAFFVELTYPGGGSEPFKFTTPVRIVPDTTKYKFVPPKLPR